LSAGVEFVNPREVMKRALRRSESSVAPIGVVAIWQVKNVCGADRRVLNFPRAAAAKPFVALERADKWG
jgi:hypothetical protein